MDDQQKHKILKGNVNKKCEVCSSLCFDCKMLRMCDLVPFVVNFKYSKTIKFYSHQLMHFFIQLCISLLSYIKIT